MEGCIFFDLDGTLTDSGPGIMNAVRYALKGMGRPQLPECELRKFVGPPLRWSFSHFCGLTEEESREAVEVFREYYTETGILENNIYPGVGEMLERLQQSGFRLAVATSKPQFMARRVLDRFAIDGCFELVVGADEQLGRYEKNEVIACALEGLGLRDGQGCVMVGDRHYDVRGGRSFGMRTLGVTYGYGDRQELAEAGADWLADSPEQARDILLRL